MRILITGASGFIGSHLVDVLCRAGHFVTAYCRTQKKISAFKHQNLNIVQGLLEDKDKLKFYLSKQDAVIHCTLGWGETATQMLQLDTLPSVALFEMAVAAGVKKLIYTSSSIATGEYRPWMDSQSIPKPIDLYSATKAATENFLFAISRETDCQCNIVRPTYTFGSPIVQGATQQPDRKILRLAQKIMAGERIDLIEHDGTQMIWVGHLAKLYQYFLNENVTRQVIVAGSQSQYKWSQLAQRLINKLNSPSELHLQSFGWLEQGCLWSTEEFNQCVGVDSEFEEHLENHLDYVCAQVATDDYAKRNTTSTVRA